MLPNSAVPTRPTVRGLILLLPDVALLPRRRSLPRSLARAHRKRVNGAKATAAATISMMIWRSCLGVGVCARAAHPIGGGGGRRACGGGGGGVKSGANQIIGRANKSEVLVGILSPPPPCSFSPLFRPSRAHDPFVAAGAVARLFGRSVGVARVVMGPKAARASGASDLGSFLATCNVCDSARAVLLMRERERDHLLACCLRFYPRLHRNPHRASRRRLEAKEVVG